jgi:uncharacterized radical SAM superfamily Fe-S cluster-containing enzyme
MARPACVSLPTRASIGSRKGRRRTPAQSDVSSLKSKVGNPQPAVNRDDFRLQTPDSRLSRLNTGTLGRNADPGDALGIQEKLSTCLALIEIVNSCNLACPTCYADSPVGAGTRVDAVPLADLQRRIQGVISV